ncbi:unnamed protein product [Vitrella brassicaformis CCMP3155]|uniref:Uncharacterized protein n=1 Tax=Vitrella brassicaformis (strain CCMP3155) TaxID=1169540 RepID=A0A0G4GDR7_VITBC|nr:unnamed protein product [Vitrella brassicaformis CCMP3155]|eukprot:CEM27504.1 unnamed protein product [Vitrella brassicaformis CCMP3155]
MAASASASHSNEAFNRVKKELTQLLACAKDQDAAELISHLETIRRERGEEGVTLADIVNQYRDGNGRGCLHFACMGGRVENVKTLLAIEGVKVDLECDVGDTPLLLAVLHNHADVVRLLLDRGAKISHLNRKGTSALHVAAEHRDGSLLEMLLNCRTDETPLPPCDVNACSTEFGTPLLWAVTQQNATAVRLLLAHGANPDLGSRQVPPPLILSASMRHHVDTAKEIFDLLLEGGADPNVEDQDGWIPLHCTAENGDAEGTQKLLSKGANPNKVTNGQTPLQLGHTFDAICALLRPVTNVAAEAAEAAKPMDIEAHGPSNRDDNANGQGDGFDAAGAFEKVHWDEAEHRKRRERAEELKTKGNQLYKNGQNAPALETYREAISVLTDDNPLISFIRSLTDARGPKAGTEFDFGHLSSCRQELVLLLRALHSNCAACHLAMDQPQQAIAQGKETVRYDPEWPKGYYRLAHAYKALGDLTQAATELGTAFTKDPHNKELKSEFREVFNQARESNQSSRLAAATEIR